MLLPIAFIALVRALSLAYDIPLVLAVLIVLSALGSSVLVLFLGTCGHESACGMPVVAVMVMLVVTLIRLAFLVVFLDLLDVGGDQPQSEVSRPKRNKIMIAARMPSWRSFWHLWKAAGKRGMAALE